MIKEVINQFMVSFIPSWDTLYMYKQGKGHAGVVVLSNCDL